MIPALSTAGPPRSAAIVDDLERRIVTEISHLVSDIRRIEPAGEAWCTFGDLFMDAAAQQYYEALVNTLKSAKRKGVIHFKGQILLKGMHDKVVVSIVGENGKVLDVHDVVDPADSDSSIVSMSRSLSAAKLGKSMNSLSVTTTNDVYVNQEKDKRDRFSQPRSTTPRGGGKGLQKYHSQRTRKSSITFSTQAGDNLELVITGDTQPPNSKRWNKKTTIVPVQTQSTAPAVTSFSKSPTSFSTTEAQNVGSSTPESHNDRVTREIDQLVIDIRRIEPEGEAFCTFGVLFDDPQVEQYYEALVGTLKAARRKGAITFKGQMLLKGMHDDVQIQIVE